MNSRKRQLFSAGLVLLVMLGVARVHSKPEQTTHHFRIIVGLKDKQPTDWKGNVQVDVGEFVSLTGWHFEDTDELKGSSWSCNTHNNIAPLARYPIQDFAGKPKGKTHLSPWPNGVHLAVKGDAPVVTVKFGERATTFKANGILIGQPLITLDGAVRIERIPPVTLARPAAPFKGMTSAFQDDYPALWIDPASGKQFLAWVCYQKEKTRVLLSRRDSAKDAWSEPLEVAGPGDHFRVALAGTADGTLWLVWSENREHAWNLVARPWRADKLGEAVSLTQGKGPNIWQRMTTDAKGRAWLVWQGSDNGRYRIYTTVTDGDKWRSTTAVSSGQCNAWDPTVTADPTTDRVWIGWDEYVDDNYRVRIASVIPGADTKYTISDALAPETTPLFQAHISLACAKDGRLWAAWDEAGTQWGKDTGYLYGGEKRTDTSRLYASRAIRVRCLADGKWQEPAVDLDDVLEPAMKEYVELPQLQIDGDGRIWLAFRHRICRRPREDGWAAQGRWDAYATAYLGDRWLPPTELPASGGRNDMRIVSQRGPDGKVFVAYASDNRPWALAGMPPRSHHVAVSELGSAPSASALKLVAGKRQAPPAPAKVHPREAEQVARIRDYKIEAGGTTYRIYRGDLHRHTDISGDGPGDGSLMDLHRYAADAAALDFVLVTDHNMGNDNEYCWWQTQQANELYTLPGKFISMYGYERSVKYPYGHRNVIWPERGHRTLPLPVKPVPGAFQSDTARLYDYLRKTGGICTSHTSATDQGTNWKDPHDPELEPFVELFQGYHTSYEYLGAPKAIDSKSDMIHGPYKEDGFVSLALDKGYKLGFQSSSDHISTHVSYACILAEEFSRKGLVHAMKKRHTYAATDNIVLDVRIGSRLMGDEVRDQRPRFDVTVLGTAPLTKVEIFRSGQVVHSEKPAGAEARFQWQEQNLPRGDKPAYYYVRVTQEDGNMAWSSPIWVSGER